MVHRACKLARACVPAVEPVAFTTDVRDSDLHVIERSLWRAGHMSGLHLQLDETRVSSYFQSIMPALSAQARTCSLQRSMTARLASKKSER